MTKIKNKKPQISYLPPLVGYNIYFEEPINGGSRTVLAAVINTKLTDDKRKFVYELEVLASNGVDAHPVGTRISHDEGFICRGRAKVWARDCEFIKVTKENQDQLAAQMAGLLLQTEDVNSPHLYKIVDRVEIDGNEYLISEVIAGESAGTHAFCVFDCILAPLMREISTRKSLYHHLEMGWRCRFYWDDYLATGDRFYLDRVNDPEFDDVRLPGIGGNSND